ATSSGPGHTQADRSGPCENAPARIDFVPDPRPRDELLPSGKGSIVASSRQSGRPSCPPGEREEWWPGVEFGPLPARRLCIRRGFPAKRWYRVNGGNRRPGLLLAEP